MKLLRYLGLLCVTSFLVVAMACGGDDNGGNGNDSAGDNPEDVVRSFFDSINDKDGSKAYNALSKDCLQGVTEEQFNQAFGLGLAVLGDAKVVLDSVDVTESGDTATAKVSGKLEGGPEGIDGLDQSDQDLPLKKEDGNWKISDCSFARGFGG